MARSDLEFYLSGADASARADALEQRLKAAFGAENVSREHREPTQGADERHTGLEIAAVVLAIPSAVLATMQFAERIKLMERLRPIIEDIQKAYDAISPPECHIRPPGESLRTPAQTSPEAVLDAAQTVAKKTS